MRSIGSRRGNPFLRASIEQSARRRMESWIWPHAGDEPGAEDLPAAPALTRAFFERIRDVLLPRSTPALSVDDAELRYLAAGEAGLWSMRAPEGLVLAVECADTPALLAERARRWLACLRTRTTPGVQPRTWGQPVYGARLDVRLDRLDVVWALPGPWCEQVLEAERVPVGGRLPQHWGREQLAGA